MKSKPDQLSEAIERLQADRLMPPVKSVEVVRGGVIRVTVVGAAEPKLRARLTAAMGSTRWTLVQARDDEGAGVESG